MRSRGLVRAAGGRGLAMGLALLVAGLAPARAFAWIPNAVPPLDASDSAGWESIADDESVFPYMAVEDQLTGEVRSFATTRLHALPGEASSRDWLPMANFYTARRDGLLGLSWLYWAGAAAATFAAVAALGGSGGGGGGGGGGQGALAVLGITGDTTSGGGDSGSSGNHSSAPVPEPSSILLLGLGAALAAFAHRRRRESDAR